MADWAEMTGLDEKFGALGTTRRTLDQAIDAVTAKVDAVESSETTRS